MRSISEAPISPDPKQIAEANSTTSHLRPRRLSPIRTLAAGLLLSSVAEAGCTPIDISPSMPITTPDNGNTGELDFSAEIARRLDSYKNYYIDPTGANHYRVEVEDPDNKYQCTDGAKALAKKYGIPTNTLTHASAKDYLNPDPIKNPGANDWWKITKVPEGQLPQVLPPKGALIVFGSGVGDGNGHVGAVLSSRREGNDILVEVISQNYLTQSMEIHTFSFKNDDARGYMEPRYLGPEGDLPTRELAFVTEPTSTQAPETTSAPNLPTPEPTVDISELTTEQQKSYYWAKNFFDYFNQNNHEIPTFTNFPSYFLTSSIIFPDGITEADILSQLAQGQEINLDTPIRVTWDVSVRDEESAHIEKGQALLNYLSVDDSVPFDPHNPDYRTIHLSTRASYITSAYTGTDKKVNEFLEAMHNYTLPDLADSWSPIFGITSKVSLTGGGAVFDNDMVNPPPPTGPVAKSPAFSKKYVDFYFYANRQTVEWP